MSGSLVAVSGGADSTGLALLMWEMGEDFDLFFTPTGNELPSLNDQLQRLAWKVGKPLIVPPNRSLAQWIEHFGALPNHRQRWCTRLIKITPCIAYLKKNPDTTLCVGLRIDEPEREGLYGAHAKYRYPLREAGMDRAAVLALCDKHGLRPKARTDCAVCPYQRLIEWYELWLYHIDMWLEGEAWEAATGHTFRSPGRDTWPASMRTLRSWFENGEVPTRSKPRDQACRVCAL